MAVPFPIVSTFYPIPQERFGWLKICESYLSLGKKQAHIVRINAGVLEVIIREQKHPSYFYTVIKAISYISIVLPILAYIGSKIYRMCNTFRVLNLDPSTHHFSCYGLKHVRKTTENFDPTSEGTISTVFSPGSGSDVKLTLIVTGTAGNIGQQYPQFFQKLCVQFPQVRKRIVIIDPEFNHAEHPLSHSHRLFFMDGKPNTPFVESKLFQLQHNLEVVVAPCSFPYAAQLEDIGKSDALRAVKSYIEESLAHGGAVFLGNCTGAWEMVCALHLLHNSIVAGSPDKRNLFYYEDISGPGDQRHIFSFGNAPFDHYRAFALQQYQNSLQFSQTLYCHFRTKVLSYWENSYIQEEIDPASFKRPEELEFPFRLTANGRFFISNDT